jgi:hypothetical protein
MADATAIKLATKTILLAADDRIPSMLLTPSVGQLIHIHPKCSRRHQWPVRGLAVPALTERRSRRESKIHYVSFRHTY